MDAANMGNGDAQARKKQTRRTWSTSEEEALMLELKELVAAGWKKDNAFRNNYLNELERKMTQHFPHASISGNKHINSKIIVWKKQFASLLTMMGTSGFGWNNEANMVVVENDIWGKYVKVYIIYLGVLLRVIYANSSFEAHVSLLTKNVKLN